MTKLTKEKIILRSASLGDVNLMPDLLDTSYIHAKCDTTANLTDEDKMLLRVFCEERNIPLEFIED